MLIEFLNGTSTEMLLASALARSISPMTRPLINTNHFDLCFRSQPIMPPTEEDLAWLRSTFHTIPKPCLPDDCVEYCLYIFESNLDPANESELRLRLREVQKHASELQKKWLKDYIWQRQAFGLELVKEDGEVGWMKLMGS